MMTKSRKPRHGRRKPLERKEKPTSVGLRKRRDSGGHTIRARLQELRSDEDLTIEAFAAKIGAPKHSTVRTWLSGKGLPRIEYLDSIATAFSVTTDWLLGKDAPKYRNEYCTSADLERDLKGYLARKVADRLHPQVTADTLDVDVEGFLQDAVTRESEGLQTWVSWFEIKNKALGILETMLHMRQEHGENRFAHDFSETDFEQIIQELAQVPPGREPFVKLGSTSAMRPIPW